MSGDFIDSNVILYALDEGEPEKRVVADRLIAEALGKRTAWISFQVVQEVLHTLTRKFAQPAVTGDARRVLDDVLLPLWRVMPTWELYADALRVRERYSYGFYDSLIIAAALTSGCNRLLSEDLQDGQRIDGLVISNPFG